MDWRFERFKKNGRVDKNEREYWEGVKRPTRCKMPGIVGRKSTSDWPNIVQLPKQCVPDCAAFTKVDGCYSWWVFSSCLFLSLSLLLVHRLLLYLWWYHPRFTLTHLLIRSNLSARTPWLTNRWEDSSTKTQLNQANLEKQLLRGQVCGKVVVMYSDSPGRGWNSEWKIIRKVLISIF